MGWLRAEPTMTRSKSPLASAVRIGAAETSWASMLLATMAGTAVAVSMYWISTDNPYLSNAPIALAIHSAANDPTGEPYDTVSFGAAAGFVGAAAGATPGETPLHACSKPPVTTPPPATAETSKKLRRERRLASIEAGPPLSSCVRLLRRQPKRTSPAADRARTRTAVPGRA